MGVRDIVKTVGNIRGFVKRTSVGIKVNIPPLTKFAKLIANALCNPRYVKLTFSISS
ncbi:hypothetical protein [Clostridium beijerinckii]|uniref:Uncharacterized protein n=1 Tax=Clostridium beijerinckii TaxID=1520 RepID=A0A9Q5CTT7_CLOBE|nr:hypothetical protein [Clostridium beijerinckii]MBA2887798.1 hypothetical protein [Clostridium beijerinckii]MBA2901688.1 hypothetical protein [Clostridium beijerinckii]MBA2911425.1 hypothetical protein [Clostridium beijerinckii]MBA9013713.1 hypothetical protein [Clostridium beijerinckii]MBC2417326.1 hypothetical protein [Clostridium beijerinckii]